MFRLPIRNVWAANAPMLVLPVLCAATMSWGADSQQAGFLYSSVILAVTAGVVLLGEGPPFPTMLASGFCGLCIYLVAIAQKPLHVEYATLVAAGAVFLCGRSLGGQSCKTTQHAWTACLVLAALYALWAVMHALIASNTDTGNARLEGSFLSANTAATLLGMIAIVSTAELRRIRFANMIRQSDHGKQNSFMGLVALTGVLFALTGVFLSGSRAGTVLCILTVIAMIALAPRGREPASLVALGALAGVAAISGGVVADRFSSVESAWQVRSDHFSAYWKAVASRPLTGQGLGGFERAVAAVSTPNNVLFLQQQGAAHNIVLQWLLQAGLIGSLMMWTLFGAVVRDIWNRITHIRSHRRILQACLGVCAFVVAHGMVDYALEIPGVMWWCAWILGLGHGVASQPRKQEK